MFQNNSFDSWKSLHYKGKVLDENGEWVDITVKLPSKVSSITDLPDFEKNLHSNSGFKDPAATDIKSTKDLLNDKQALSLMIYEIIGQNGPCSFTEIKKKLNSKFSSGRIGWIRLFFILKGLDLNTFEKRKRVYRSC